jgi:hypothetical protein
VKHVIAKRFDNGSMRWIRERAETLLQLRCIEVNGDWDRFVEFVHKEVARRLRAKGSEYRVMTWSPGPLPVFGLTA